MFGGSDKVLLVLLLVILADAAVHSEVLSCVSKELKSMPRKPCKFPESDDHYYLSFNGTTRFKPKTDEIEGNGQQAVKVKCFDTTKQSKAPDLVVCFDGEWYPSDHGCVPITCDPVCNTNTTIFTCTTPQGRNVSCEQPNPIGTQITIQCSHWRYTNPNKNNNRKSCVDGKWEKWDTCKPQCGMIGKPAPESKVTMSEEALYENPWHVVIYHLLDNKWTQRCVGTIINSRVIITARSCSYPNPESVKVSVGQHYKDFETAQSLSRIYNVHKVYISNYTGIALIETEANIEYNDTVGSACYSVNWKKDNKAFMAILKEDDKTGSTSKATELLTYGPNEECQIRYAIDDVPFADDYFCAKIESGRKVNPTDIGAGYMFRIHLVREIYTYSLRGILINSKLMGQVLPFIDIWHNENQKFIDEVIRSIGVIPELEPDV